MLMFQHFNDNEYLVFKISLSMLSQRGNNVKQFMSVVESILVK